MDFMFVRFNLHKFLAKVLGEEFYLNINDY